MAYSGSAYTSDIFTMIVGPTQEQLLVHEAILAQSPVFRAMTQLPFIERQERTIRLPDDQASYLRCLVAFLYTSDYTTESEPEDDQESGDDGSRCGSEEAEEEEEPEEAEAETEEKEAEARRYARRVTIRDRSPLQAYLVVEAQNSGKRKFNDGEFCAGKEAVAQELAHMYILSDKYQLPRLKPRTLMKLKDLEWMSCYPLKSLHLLTIFLGCIPDPDDDIGVFVQASLLKAAVVAEQRETKDEVVDAMIECGYLSQGGMLAEAILRAFAGRRKSHQGD